MQVLLNTKPSVLKKAGEYLWQKVAADPVLTYRRALET
jgi:hypothetical protein